MRDEGFGNLVMGTDTNIYICIYISIYIHVGECRTPYIGSHSHDACAYVAAGAFFVGRPYALHTWKYIRTCLGCNEMGGEYANLHFQSDEGESGSKLTRLFFFVASFRHVLLPNLASLQRNAIVSMPGHH